MRGVRHHFTARSWCVLSYAENRHATNGDAESDGKRPTPPIVGLTAFLTSIVGQQRRGGGRTFPSLSCVDIDEGDRMWQRKVKKRQIAYYPGTLKQQVLLALLSSQ